MITFPLLNHIIEMEHLHNRDLLVGPERMNILSFTIVELFIFKEGWSELQKVWQLSEFTANPTKYTSHFPKAHCSICLYKIHDLNWQNFGRHVELTAWHINIIIQVLYDSFMKGYVCRFYRMAECMSSHSVRSRL